MGWATKQAVVLRVGGAFPQLYLNGQPEEVEENTTSWEDLGWEDLKSCHLMDVKHHTWKIHQKVGRTFGQFGQFNFWKVSSSSDQLRISVDRERQRTLSVKHATLVVKDGTTPWSELEDIVYAKNQYLILGKVPWPHRSWVVPKACAAFSGMVRQMERQLLDGKMQTSIEIHLKRTSEMCCNFTSKCIQAVLNPLLDLIDWWMLVVSAGVILAIAQQVWQFDEKIIYGCWSVSRSFQTNPKKYCIHLENIRDTMKIE